MPNNRDDERPEQARARHYKTRLRPQSEYALRPTPENELRGHSKELLRTQKDLPTALSASHATALSLVSEYGEPIVDREVCM